MVETRFAPHTLTNTKYDYYFCSNTYTITIDIKWMATINGPKENTIPKTYILQIPTYVSLLKNFFFKQAFVKLVMAELNKKSQLTQMNR